MRSERSRQLMLIPSREILWDRLPEERRKLCRQLLVRLLRMVEEVERQGRRSSHE